MNFFNSLKFVSNHRRKVLNGSGVFLEHQRDVLDRKQHAKAFFRIQVGGGGHMAADLRNSMIQHVT